MTAILEAVRAGHATIVPWTVEFYHRTVRGRLLAEDASVELIDGFIVRKDRAGAGKDPRTIGDRHRVAVVRLSRLGPLVERQGCFLQSQQPISLPPLSEPEPDGAVVRGTIDDYLDQPPSVGDLLSVIEVADSSLAFDLGPKLAAYATAGVPQYIVVDLVNDRVLIHQAPTGQSYSLVEIRERHEMVSIATAMGAIEIAATQLLP